MVLEVSDYCFGACVEKAYLTCSPWGPEVKEEEGRGFLQCTWGHAPDLHEASPLKDSHYLLIVPQNKDQAFAMWAPSWHSRDTTVATEEIRSLANEFQTLLKNREPSMMLKNLWERKSGEGAQDFTFWDVQSPVIFVFFNCVYACRIVWDFVQASVTAHRGQKSFIRRPDNWSHSRLWVGQHECWELSSGPLQEHYLLLNAAPSLHSKIVI